MLMAVEELLALRGVRLHYQRGGRHAVQVLDGVSLSVGAGEVVCVLAGRGQGKTTLMRVAAGMECPTGGCVLFEGEDLWQLAERRRVELVGDRIRWVASEAPAFAMPVLDHIAMPARGRESQHVARAQASAALELVGASHCAALQWGALDDRERALLALARAAVGEPKLLVVDDLALGLDAGGADEVGRLLARLAHERGCGVLASVSSARETRWSDRIATLGAGELLAPSAGPKRKLGGAANLSNR
jgi:ABC-type cobalamin/Fe3+-siderophores transport system ATPase subunit